METLSEPSNLNRAFSRMSFTCFAFSKARGFAGGIVMGWKAEKLQVHVLKCHFQFIHSQSITEEGKACNLFNVYANPLEDKKKELWNELTNIVTSMSTVGLLRRGISTISSI